MPQRPLTSGPARPWTRRAVGLIVAAVTTFGALGAGGAVSADNDPPISDLGTFGRHISTNVTPPVLLRDIFEVASDPGAAIAAVATNDAGGTVSASDYHNLIDSVAERVATEVGANPVVVADAWKTASLTRQQIVFDALSRHGATYRYASAGPNSYDCSGLVVAVYRSVGIELPHQSAGLRNATERTSNLQPGDLLFYTPRGTHISHVAIYLAPGVMIHASGAGRNGVVLAELGDYDYTGTVIDEPAN